MPANLGLVRSIPAERVSATVACAAVAALMAGCGASHETRTTKASAVAFADAVNLAPGDVPEMHSFGGREAKGSIVHFELTPKRGCGVGDRGERFDVYSPSFSTGRGYPQRLPAEGLHSRVAVMRSAGEQQRDFAARECDIGRTEAASGTARTRPLSAPLPGVGVNGLRTWRVAPRYMFGAAAVSQYSDRFSFVMGPAEVVLAVTSSPRPPRAGLERRLLSLLYERAHQLQPVLAGKQALIIE
jgi:hypothetical protein